MIEREYVERINAKLADEKTMSYLLLIQTSDNETGIDMTASLYDVAVMLANAAINSRELLIAIDEALKMLEEYCLGQS